MERSFFDMFSVLEDPRNVKGRIFPLMDVIILAIYGTLIGFEDFTNMSYYLKKREAELTEGLGLTAGVPSHDVFSDVFRLLDIKAFMAQFVEWTKELVRAKTGKQIAIDGKAVRAATKKTEGGKIPYVLSAFLVDQGISIGQKAVGNKTNEISEIPKLLDLIDVKDCFVTVDAIGTQTKIMDKVLERGGHFCLQLKSNQKTAFESAKLYFDDLETKAPRLWEQLDCYKEPPIKNHGRIESREYRVMSDADDIRMMFGEAWEQVKCIGMARLVRRIGNEESSEVHYHLLDTPVIAEKYASLARGHWGIENSLHWILDIHFKEDASTANADAATENLALLRKICFNFTKLDPQLAKKTTKKKMIDYMTDLELFKHLIYDVIPRIE